MNETANPKPARRADAHRLAGQLSGDPLAPGATRFLCQSINGQPKLVFQLDGGAMRCAHMPKAGMAGRRKEGRGRHGSINLQGRGKNRVFSLGNVARIGFYSVLQKLGIRVDLNLRLLQLQQVASGLQDRLGDVRYI